MLVNFLADTTITPYSSFQFTVDPYEKNPTYGSSPTASNAVPHIPASKEYAKDNISFTLSNGGLLFLPWK